MIDYPFKIPGYGIIQDEEALKLFMEIYKNNMERLRLLVSDNERLYNQIPNNIMLWIKGGVLQDIVAQYKGNVQVTVLDLDNLQEEDDEINPIEIVIGDYPIDELWMTPEEYVKRILGDSFNYVIKEQELF